MSPLSVLCTTTGPSNNLIHISQLDDLVDKQGNVKALQLSLCQYKHSIAYKHCFVGPMGRLFLEHSLLRNLMQLSSLTTLIHPCIKVIVFA